MMAIDSLLRRAGELNDAGLTEIRPALAEIAAIQASLAEALSPFYRAAAAASGMEPLRYGFTMPAEPPEIKAEPAETPVPGAEVTIGPVHVQAIVQEIQKAMEDIGRESADVPAIYSSYIAPGALPVARAQALERAPAFAPEQVDAIVKDAVIAPRAIERPQPAAHERFEQAVRSPAGRAPDRAPEPQAAVKRERMAAVSSEEWVEKSIRRSTVVMSDLNEVRRNIVESTLAIDGVYRANPEAIGLAWHGPPTLKAGAPAEETPVARPAMPEKQPEQAAKPAPPQKAVEVPPIRPKPKAAMPAEEAAYNAGSLSDALARSAESVRLPEAGRQEAPVKAEWPAVSTPKARDVQVPAVPVEPPRAPEFILPAAGVARSFSALGEYMRTVVEVGAVPAVAAGSPLQGMDTGRALFDAIAQGPSISEPSPGQADNEAGMIASNIQISPGRPVLLAGAAAVQAIRSPGLSMIRELVRSAPAIAGSGVPPGASAYGSGYWIPPASPIAASGGESILNITVPPAGKSIMNEGGTTSKVSNFHNTFNITVNVKGGEEKDLKDLGRKIGQILSDEIKRYGGLA